VPGSENRPHFSGPAFIRLGSKTEKASDTLIDQLIAERTAVSYEILKWKGKTVTLYYENQESTEARIIDCNAFWISFKATGMAKIASSPLSRVELSTTTEEKDSASILETVDLQKRRKCARECAHI
jgi:hypothetical protein